jgi:hypothetical protein
MNKKTLSIISVGRDDKFADDFISRFKRSISSNIRFLEKNNITFEYIIVDWFPIKNQFLYINDDLKELLKDSRVKNIIVNNSIAKKENINPEIFYEYFAKNVGIRASKNDYILIINSDIIVPQSAWSLINDILSKENLESKNFYRPYERVNVEFINNSEIKVVSRLILEEKGLPDECICGGYSGDFLFVSRDILINVGQGYNETDSGHRSSHKWQTGMDAEILWNMHNRGVYKEFLKTPYYHISHGNSSPETSLGIKQVDGIYRLNITYENKPNWGFIDYNKNIISNNVIEIS